MCIRIVQDWYLKDIVSSKVIKISGANKQPLSSATLKAAWVRNIFTSHETIPKYPFEVNVVIRQQVEYIKMKILNLAATGAEIVKEIETVLHSDVLTPQQKRKMRGLQENGMTLDIKIRGIRISEQYFKSEKETVQKQLEDARKAKADEKIIKALEDELKRFETQEIICRHTRF